MKRRPLPLHVHVEDAAPPGESAPDATYVVSAQGFSKANVQVTPEGVTLALSPSDSRTLSIDAASLQLLDVVGRGASSYVQRAVHRPSGRTLALKVISVYDKSKREQLIKELNALFTTQCEALVGFGGAFHHEGAISVALEWMDGGSLASVLRARGPLPERALAGVGFQILHGLAYLKRQRRLHRDVKPSNVLLSTSDGSVKLSDFGLAAELSNSIGMAATFVGTCKWMAPERIAHQPYGFPSDVWAAGLVLLEAATGAYPYPEARTYIEMASEICDSEAPSLPPAAPDGSGAPWSAGLRQLLSAALRKPPAERLPADVLLGAPWFRDCGVVDFPSAREAVRAWLAGGGGGSAPQGGSAGVPPERSRGGGPREDPIRPEGLAERPPLADTRTPSATTAAAFDLI
jgi:serine/threonine protein kinase